MTGDPRATAALYRLTQEVVRLADGRVLEVVLDERGGSLFQAYPRLPTRHHTPSGVVVTRVETCVVCDAWATSRGLASMAFPDGCPVHKRGGGLP